MLWLFQGLWKYRSEVLLAIQLINQLRHTAREFTREYIKKTIEKKLKIQLVTILVEVMLFVLAWMIQHEYPGLPSRLLSSAVLWTVTLYNLHEFLFVTIPELRTVHRVLSSKVGYAVRYFLEISIITELTRLNILWLAICLMIGLSSRTFMGLNFSYFEPWERLF